MREIIARFNGLTGKSCPDPCTILFSDDLFIYPQVIRKIIYTTNAIESLDSVIRMATKSEWHSQTMTAPKKVIYPAIQEASKKMDHADQQMEAGIQSVYYRIRIPFNGLTLNPGSYAETYTVHR
jgi:transposase-like protein